MWKLELPRILLADGKHAGMDNTVHGHQRFELDLRGHSGERAERLRALIEKALPETEATYLNTVVQSAEDMDQEERILSLAEEEAEREALRNAPAVRAHIEEIMRKHWESWPDMELSALQGKTPRQAVQDELGRQQVNALLEDAERTCRKNNGALGSIENLQWVRRTLGLEKL